MFKKKIIWIVTSIVVVSAVVVIILLNNNETKTDEDIKVDDDLVEMTEPQFVKEGELTLLNNDKKEIVKIDIEKAEGDEEQAQGLMYRSKMDEKRGMLFISNKEEMKSFWMKNTIMSLDIIFINKDKQIVHIAKYCTPYSEAVIPSEKLALYVLEVNAGFCDKYKISKGNFINYE